MPRTTTKVTIRRRNGEVVSQCVLGPGEHTIGRAQENGSPIDDPHISREHARLVIGEEHVEVEDLSSTSGTFLDGVPVRGRVPVKPGQKVHLSDLYLDIEREGFAGLVEGARLGEGRFTLVRKLGQGGMGEVWLALDETAREHVALKLLPEDVAENVAGLRDLEREVKKTQFLNHPNIVRMGGLWTPEGEPAFLTLEFVDGIDLEKIRGQAPDNLLAWDAIQGYLLQLADALDFAHSHKIAHRDIKPANLLIDGSGQLKLADFGIAASIAGTMGMLTRDALSAGTPSYMSPQQVEGHAPQAGDDIYSLGAAIYELLTSRPPFYTGEIIYQVIHTPATPMDRRLQELGLKNDIPDYVGAMVMACLQKDPAKRPPSASAIRRWIETAGQAGDIMAGPRQNWAAHQQPPRKPAGRGQSATPTALPGVALPESPELHSPKQKSVVSEHGAKRHLLKVLVGAVLIGIGVAAWQWVPWDTVLKPDPAGSQPAAAEGEFAGREVMVLDAPAILQDVVFSPDGQRVAAVNDDAQQTHKLYLWNIADGVLWKEFEFDYVPAALDFHPDGNLVAIGAADSSVRLFDINQGQELNELRDVTSSIQVVRFSHDGRLVAGAAVIPTMAMCAFGKCRTAPTWPRCSTMPKPTSWRSARTTRSWRWGMSRIS